MVAHNCHGKTKNLMAKTKTSRQKQKHHGKTKNLTAKTKYLAAKTKTSRQNQILHSKSKIALVLPWVFALAMTYLHSFCCVFGFVVRYFVFAVRYFVFAVRYFVFAVRFLVLP